ncbi:MAG: hypothetical protein RMI90_08555 [Thermoguttaceae bacterium]|nr:hypothetical protein [Thermoguttaceae bacterium]
MVYEVQQQLVLLPSVFDENQKLFLESIINRLSDRDILPIFDEIYQPDRRALDEVVFDVLGLTAGEREAVYEAVVELVRNRLDKAQSLGKKR